jgi:hypothetical protein
MSFDRPVAEPPGAGAPRRGAHRPPPERYRVADAAKLLQITPGALRRRATSGAIAFERSEYGEHFVTRAELARHVAEYTPCSGGRPATASDEIVGRIEALRADGLSYARIAALLTLEGAPTAHGADRWWPSSVRAVLVRRRTRRDTEAD